MKLLELNARHARCLSSARTFQFVLFFQANKNSLCTELIQISLHIYSRAKSFSLIIFLPSKINQGTDQYNLSELLLYFAKARTFYSIQTDGFQRATSPPYPTRQYKYQKKFSFYRSTLQEIQDAQLPAVNSIKALKLFIVL